MDIHMKLKDRRTFLLGGALLLFLLLFAMMSSVAAADNLTIDNVNSTTVGNLTRLAILPALGNLITDNINSTTVGNLTRLAILPALGNLTSLCVNITAGQVLKNLLRYIITGGCFAVNGAYIGVAMVQRLYTDIVLECPTVICTTTTPSTGFVVTCGFAGAATAVAGGIVGAITGEKVGELAAEWVLGDDRFKGDEEAVGGLAGYITGGPAGAIAFGLIGLKTGADAGLLAGSDKGEEIAQNRESNN